jgi:TetR/AcrR family transcriptional repressor of nem operon
MQAKTGKLIKPHSDATADLILDVAQELLQTRGYNGISYQDIAEQVGIRKASIHHHFATKAELGVKLLCRYRRQWQAFLAGVDESTAGPWEKFDQYLDPFRATARTGDRACLCGILGAEFAALAPELQQEVQGFFRDNETWLAALLSNGRRSRQFRFQGDAASEAAVIFACLEGSLIVARAARNPLQFDAVIVQLKGRLGR